MNMVKALTLPNAYVASIFNCKNNKNAQNMQGFCLFSSD